MASLDIHKLSRAYASLWLLALIGSGCASSAATESELEGAVQEYLKTRCATLYDAKSDFPVTVEPFAIDDPPSRERFQSKLKSYQTLVNVGLLEEESGPLVEVHSYTDSGQVETRQKESRVFSLTDAGKVHFRPPSRGGMLKIIGDGGFCVGRYTLERIVNFTEPAAAEGVVTTQVEFTYLVKDVPEWAGDVKINEEFPGLRAKLESGQVGSAVLIKRPDGWVHEKLLK